MKTRPAKIGCGAISVLLGSSALTYLAAATVPRMDGSALAFLLGSNFILWAGLLAFIEGQKEDIINRLREKPRQD